MTTAESRAVALAVEGGPPVRGDLLPYGRQTIDDGDIAAVVEVLRSDWLTTGPKIADFEQVFADAVGATHAVAVSSGTAALHAAVFAAGVGPGDEAITTPLTFCSTANSVLFQGGTPVFADIREDTLTIDVDAVEAALTPATRALIAVDFAGHPADLDALRAVADQRGIVLIEDACHALGATLDGRAVGSIADMTVFSFHPVKHVATGEGGMVTTDDAELARRLRLFRTHGIESDPRQRQEQGRWYYEMTELGYNYRLTDIACALGISQLAKLDANVRRRRAIASAYEERIGGLAGLVAPVELPGARSAWHLYPIRVRPEALSVGRAEVFAALWAEGLGVNVHYIPVHLHPYYRNRFGFGGGEFPRSEQAYERLISLPMFHGMTDDDVDDVVEAVTKVFTRYAA